MGLRKKIGEINLGLHYEGGEIIFLVKYTLEWHDIESLMAFYEVICINRPLNALSDTKLMNNKRKVILNTLY